MKKDTILFILSEIEKELQNTDIETQLYLIERREINLKKLGMDYKGKLYGKIGRTYFDTGKTSDNYDELLKFVKEMAKRYPNSPWIYEQANELIKKAEG